MLLRLKESVFGNVLPDENGDIFTVYRVIDDINKYIVGSQNLTLKNTCFRNKILKKNDIFLKIKEIEYSFFLGKKKHKYKMLKVLCQTDNFWVFDHNFNEIWNVKI